MTNFFPQPCDEGVNRALHSGVPCTRVSEPWILTATILGSSMAFIDGTVVNVALPVLRKNLNATVLVLVIALLHVPESRDDDAATTLDWPGDALATLGLGILVYGLIESSSLGFSHPLVLATLASAVVAFMVIDKR